MKKFALFLVTILVISCKTVLVNQQSQKTTKKAVELGTIGAVKQGVLADNFSPTTVPVYKQKIRVLADIVAFNKNTFKVCTNAAIQQNKPLDAVYIDSLFTKPNYVSLHIIDKVQLLTELNAPHNISVNKYLRQAYNNSIVMGLSVYFETIELSSISQADEIYLINNKPKKYNLELVKNGKPFALIDVSKSVPFAYTSASFCWKKQRGNISIANLVDTNESCGRDMYKDATRLNKRINYFKY